MHVNFHVGLHVRYVFNIIAWSNFVICTFVVFCMCDVRGMLFQIKSLWFIIVSISAATEINNAATLASNTNSIGSSDAHVITP